MPSYDDPAADVCWGQVHGNGPFVAGRWTDLAILGASGRCEEEPVTYVIAQPCVDLKDRACVDECPVDCIYEGSRMLYIHPDECVDCGACEPVCPVEAIFYEDDVPDQWKDYYSANVDFFDDLGSPGGAAKTGVIEKDHPLIAALPPQITEE
jgi:NAD-dependent dihydropyrimidine dehydrogenase PreA subunit